LTASNINGAANGTISYYPNGNINRKSDAGICVYDPTKFNVVSRINNLLNITTSQQNITIPLTISQVSLPRAAIMLNIPTAMFNSG